MSQQTRSQVSPLPKTSFTPVQSNLLQRKCGCSQSANLTGQCSECQRKKLAPERGSTDLANESNAPPIVHEVLRSSFPKIQPKLKVSQPNDKYEQEADRIADQIMRMPEQSVTANRSAIEGENLSIQRLENSEDERDHPEENLQLKRLVGAESIQRQELEEDEEKDEEEEMLQTKRSSSQVPEVTPNIETGIESLRRSGGQPLPPSIRTFMEPRFGYDFSKVRLHTTGNAVQLANQLNAQAFTAGHDIVLGAGISSGQTTARTHLLAHELTHVIQQSRTDVAISSSSHSSIPSIQRSLATVETQENNEKDLNKKELRKAKLFKGTVNRWLRRIARKIARGEKIEPKPRQIRLAERALLLIRAGEVDLPTDNSKAVRDQLEQLTAVKFEEENPIIIQASPEEELSIRALEEPNNQLIASETETQPLANRGNSIICPGNNSSDIDISVEFHDSHKAVPVKKEGADNIRARIYSGQLDVPITIRAKPSKLSRIEPNTSASQSLLAAWEVGPSQTLYRDFAAATYEMSQDLDDTILNAKGPMIDISDKRINKVPFAQDPIGLNVLENNPAWQRLFISSDQPYDVMNVVNPPVPGRTTGATHNDCSPPDKLTRYLRMFDATLFVLARHRPTGTICPIAHLDWQANIDVKVFNIDAKETSVGKFEIRDVDFQPPSVDGIRVTGRGKGNGRVPELTARGGNVANTIPRDKPGFIIVKPCP